MKTLQDKVYNYPTKHKMGFLLEELNELLKDYPNINMDKFNDALLGNTCGVDANGKLIQYHCDIVTAPRCGIENRDVYLYEWD